MERESIEKKAYLYELSSIQNSMWLTQRMYPDSSLFNVGGYCKFEKHVGANKIIYALEQVINVHEVFRTKFVEDNGRVFQEIVDSATGIVKVIDMEANALDDYISKEMECGLSLKRPYEFVVINTEHNTLVFMKMHHLLCDGYGISILVNSFKKVMENDNFKLDIQINYSDFIKKEQKYLLSNKYKLDEEYWLNEVDGVKEIAFENCRTNSTTTEKKINRKEIAIAKGLFEEISKSIENNRATIYHYAIANIVLLNYIYNNGDFYIGLPVLNRVGKNKEVIGSYVKVMPIGIETTKDDIFGDILRRITEKIYGGYKHLNYPLSEIGKKKEIKGLLYNVTFSYQRTHYPDSICDIPVKVQYVNQSEQQEDLTFHLLENLDAAEDVVFCVDYNQDLFSSETIDIMLKRYQELFLTMYKNLEKRICDVEAMNELDIQNKINQYQSTTCAFPKNKCMYEYFEEQSKENPQRIAVSYQSTRITYKDLEKKTATLAKYLQKQGVNKNTLIGICMERSLEMVIAIMGTYRSGGAYVPIDPDYPKERISYMLDDSQVKIILTQEKFRSLLIDTENVICLDSDWEKVSNAENEILLKISNPEDWAYMIYTSGSTGKPKGAINNHRALVNRVVWMQKEMNLTKTDVVLQKTPFSFDVSVWEFVWPLMVGATIVMAEPGGHRKPDYLADIIEREGVTTLHFVPSMLRIFADNVNNDRCKSLKRIICSGEELKADLMRLALQKFNCDLYNLYGPTEAAIDVSYWKCYDRKAMKIVPIGKAIDNIQLYVLNKDRKLLPDGFVGEIYISGVGLAEGYYNKKELTDEKFVENTINPNYCSRMYKTNDLARYNELNEIEYLGRADFQVKINGLRIELGEIEYELEQIDNIHQAKVIVFCDEQGNKSLVAYLEKDKYMEEYEAKDIKKILRKHLPVYMIPTSYVYMDKLPLSPNGKLDRNALPKFNEKALNDNIVLPRNNEEKELLDLFKEVLGVEQLGIDDDFFENGGTSLKGIQLVSKYKKIEIDELFKYSTVSDIVHYVNESKEKSAHGCLNALIENEFAQYSVICIPYGGGTPTVYQDFSRNFSKDYNVYAVNLEGHSYTKETPLLDIYQMSEIVVSDIKKYVNGEIIVYGHCVGSALAFEITRKLNTRGIPVKVLFVAGTSPYYRNPIKRYLASYMAKYYYSNNERTEKFIHKIGGLTEDLAATQKEKMFSWFRHDGASALNYFEKMRKAKEKVECMVVITGENDPLTMSSKKDLMMWGYHANSISYVEIRNVKHYFIQDAPKEVAEIIMDSVYKNSVN